jgi:uncharacterized protein (DUF362 family)
MTVDVGVVQAEKPEYPTAAPYHPSQRFPEYRFGDDLSSEPNFVYAAVRQLFVELGYDREHFDTADWNPLGFLVEPGMTVVLKPNFVRSRHFERKDPFAMITHPSVLRAIADYVWIALKGEGKIIIADAPQYDANWGELLELTKLDEVENFFNAKRAGSFDVFDLRNYWSRRKHFPSMVIPLDGDPNGIVTLNLGDISAVKRITDPKKLYGAVYHRQELIKNHTDDKQIYELSGTVMKADVVISIPKLKTHKKVGVTMNIKGLVGISTNKNLIVHYSLGRKEDGGDQYPPNHFTPMEERLIRTERWMYDTFLAKRSVPLEYVHRSIYWLHGKFIRPLGIKVEKEKRLLDVGNWYGNDSAWRMCVDLIKLIMFADKDGGLHQNRKQRRLFSIIDGIVGGENKGPLEPDPNRSGVLIASESFLAADIVGARLMGFDPMKVKTLSYLLSDSDWDYGVKEYADINVRSADASIRDCLDDSTNKFFDYKPYPGWVGHIEI